MWPLPQCWLTWQVNYPMGRYLLISTLGEATEALTHTRQTKYPPLQRTFTRESDNLQHEITRFPLHSCNFLLLHCARVWRIHNARVRIKCNKRLWVGSNGNSRRTVGKGWKICRHLQIEAWVRKCQVVWNYIFTFVCFRKVPLRALQLCMRTTFLPEQEEKGLSDTTEAPQLKRKSYPSSQK